MTSRPSESSSVTPAMNKTSTSTGVLEFVNLALAIFSWLFSDIQFSLKVIITSVLIGIVVLSKFKLASWLSRLSMKPTTLLLFGFPIISSFVMFHLASLCYSNDLHDSLLSPLPLSLVYGLLVSLPIVIISATLSKRTFSGFDLGFIGSVTWFFLVFGLVSLGRDINLWKISVFGPLAYAFVGNQCGGDSYSNNFLIMLLISLGSFFLIPTVFYYFGMIWRSKNGLLWK